MVFLSKNELPNSYTIATLIYRKSSSIVFLGFVWPLEKCLWTL